MAEQYKAPDGTEYVDFDALDEEPIRIKVKGKLYEVENDIPTDFGLSLRRKMETFDNNESAMLYMMEQILGENFETIKRDAGLKKFTAISEHLMEKILGMKKPEPEEGNVAEVEAPVESKPESPSTSSSNTGPSLRPITGGFGLQDPATIEQGAG